MVAETSLLVEEFRNNVHNFKHDLTYIEGQIKNSVPFEQIMAGKQRTKHSATSGFYFFLKK